MQGSDDWDSFDWEHWGTAPAEGGRDGHGQVGQGVAASTENFGDGRLTEIADTEDANTSEIGKWVSEGGVLHWEGPEESDEPPTLREEAASAWARDDVDLPPAAPSSARIRAARAWMAHQRMLEVEAMGLLLGERRRLREQSSGEQPPLDSEEAPLDLALTEHAAAIQEYERLIEVLQDIEVHTGLSRVLVEFHLALTERLAELAAAPEAPDGFAAALLLAEVEGEEANLTNVPQPSPRSEAEWQGRAEAVMQARRRVERVSLPEPED